MIRKRESPEDEIGDSHSLCTAAPHLFKVRGGCTQAKILMAQPFLLPEIVFTFLKKQISVKPVF